MGDNWQCDSHLKQSILPYFYLQPPWLSRGLLLRLLLRQVERPMGLLHAIACAAARRLQVTF